MDKNAPDWTIADLYQRSFEVIKKNKILWIFGIAAAGAGLGNYSNFRSFGNFDSDTFKNLPGNLFKDAPANPSVEHLTQVLGSSTDVLSQLFTTVPAYLYILLGLELLLVFIFGMIITLIYKAWADGALIYGIQMASQNATLSIQDLSEKSFTSIKPLIWLQIVPWLIFLLISAALSAISISLITIGSTRIVGLIFLFVSLLIIVYGLILLNLSSIWALRKIVLDKQKAADALKLGYKIAREKYWSMSLLGAVNAILGILIMIIPAALIIAPIIGGVFLILKNPSFLPGLIIGGAILFLILIIALQIIGGILYSFKACIWTLAYNSIKGKYEGSS